MNHEKRIKDVTVRSVLSSNVYKMIGFRMSSKNNEITALQTNFHDLYKAKQARSIINQTAKDLLSKDLFPEYTRGYLTDSKMLDAAAKDFQNQTFKSWVCPHCQIELFAPKSWIIQHLKTHTNKIHDRENEIKESKVRIYR